MKHFLLLASLLLGGTATTLAQQPAFERPTRPQRPTPGLAPIEAQHSRAEKARPTSTMRQPGRVSTYDWNRNTNQWGPGSISTHTYNNQGLVTSTTAVDSLTQVPNYRITYTYNAAGSSTQYMHENWQGSAWQNSHRFLSSYDGQNNGTEYIGQNWVAGAWQNTVRVQYTYDVRGDQTQSLYQRWVGNAWQTTDSYQDSYTYDAAGRLTAQQSAVFDTALGAFVPIDRYQYTYAGSSVTYSSYDFQQWVNNAWLNISRYTSFVYTSQNQVGYYESQTWDGAAWQPSGRTTHTYPASGLGYSYLSQRLIGSTWQNDLRLTLAYDTQGTLVEDTQEQWRNNSWVYGGGLRHTVSYEVNNDLARLLYQNPVYGTRLFVNTQKWFYSNYQTYVLGSRAPVAVLPMQLHPNPTTGPATLALTGLRGAGEVQITVLNALGQTVRQLAARPQAGTLRQELNLTGLPAGVYSVRASTPQGSVVQRLVRE